MNIAINGFGRIGRNFCRQFFKETKNNINLVAVNDLTEIETLAHLLRRDSCYGVYDKSVETDKNNLIINGRKVCVLAEKDPAKLPWRDLKVDVVIEATGRFLDNQSAGKHILSGARKVILSAPAKDAKIKTIVLGINEKQLKKSDAIISMASCTTNCLAPIMQIVEKSLGIKKALMTTIHAYTADQNLVDGPHRDLRRARAAAFNIVPTSTGAAKAMSKVIPKLKNKFDGLSLRVPVPVVSLCDVTLVTKRLMTREKLNKIFIQAARSKMYKNILKAISAPLVSSDLTGDTASLIVDLELTQVVDGDLVKVVAWYDNESGYSARLVDLCYYINKKKLI